MSTPMNPPTGGAAEKFVLKSRAFWAMASPVLAILLSQTGANEALFGAADTFVTAGLGLVGAGAWLWHHVAPDFARVRIWVSSVTGGGSAS